MRSRYFLIVTAVLLLVTSASVVLHSYLQKRSRLFLLDQQVRETAAALIDSELGELRIIDFAQADEIISEELGENRIGKFFAVRNDEGKVIYESTSATVLPVDEIPRSPRWVTIERNDQYIRILNLQLPRFPGRTLQVGVAIDQAFIAADDFTNETLYFAGAIVTLGFAAAWFLTSTLMKPITNLSTFISSSAQLAKSRGQLPQPPPELTRLAGTRPHDEFNVLVEGLSGLIAQLNNTHQTLRSWTYQLAHELKTPLTLLNVEVSDGVKTHQISESAAVALKRETEQIVATINSFLGWAELESANIKSHMYGVRAGEAVRGVVERLERRYPNRIHLNIRNDFTVLAVPQHLDQIAQNLVTNALAYSSPESKVDVFVQDDSIKIADTGPGIPAEVLTRLGQPFNRSEGAPSQKLRGQGLGLAWVAGLTNSYGWKLNIQSSMQGTAIVVSFPTEAEL